MGVRGEGVRSGALDVGARVVHVHQHQGAKVAGVVRRLRPDNFPGGLEAYLSGQPHQMSTTQRAWVVNGCVHLEVVQLPEIQQGPKRMDPCKILRHWRREVVDAASGLFQHCNCVGSHTIR